MTARKKVAPLYITGDEMNRLVKKIRKPRHRLGLAIMAYAGLRVSEMCCLKVKDIHLARGFMRVTGKGGKERIVPLSSFLQREVEEYLTRYGADLKPESLLLGRTRAAWHYVIKKYSRSHLDRSDIHCHTLRHSFATAIYQDGIPIERVSELLGHARLDTTMIYSHISMEQKREAVMVLDDRRSKILWLLRPLMKKRPDLQVKDAGSVIGREHELKQLNEYVSSGLSVVLYGPRGCGKSFLLKQLKCEVYISEYRKKPSLIRMLLAPRNLDPDIYREAEKALKKLSIDELVIEIGKNPVVVVVDDISDLSKPDRKNISRVAENVTVITSTSRRSDTKLFRTFMEIKPLKPVFIKQILSEMIHMNDQIQKGKIIDDIALGSGNNLREAVYIATQMQLGKRAGEIKSEVRESKQVSIAPVLLIVVLFFFSWVLKSYTTSIVAMSYAMLIVFRMVFMRFMFMPANRKRKL